ncbi:type II toxin-antitoxin system VapC family toxin [Haloferula sp. A504]|uniref:type II toxin-antitoxin system VapC family toxin n=1 Tax=Haloferula sp. A504 TaxID=3373601 RepID=UPI0031C05250|nr:type II toxin-antitoxin system VapC family toxin [Verrucomicrobiaceae bacterium E54]
MRFLLDSNVISELRSVQRCAPEVRAWEQKTPLASCWISVVTLLEIRRGIDQIEPKDPRFGKLLGQWLEGRVKPAFEGRTLAVTAAVAERAGKIAAGRTRGLADCLIAATALEHHLILATRNVADFEDLEELKVVNPWNGPQAG